MGVRGVVAVETFPAFWVGMQVLAGETLRGVRVEEKGLDSLITELLLYQPPSPTPLPLRWERHWREGRWGWAGWVEEVYNRMKIDSDWSQQLLEEMQQVGASLHEKYSPIVSRYAAVVVPFETRRLGADQALLFENTSLERDKMELLRRLEQLKTENERFEYSLEKQLQKINDL